MASDILTIEAAKKTSLTSKGKTQFSGSDKPDLIESAAKEGHVTSIKPMKTSPVDSEGPHSEQSAHHQLNDSMEEIEEESEGVDISESIVMLVQDYRDKADQRKAEFSARRQSIQNRLQDLEELRINRELTQATTNHL